MKHLPAALFLLSAALLSAQQEEITLLGIEPVKKKTVTPTASPPMIAG